jgi:hypothetical protein
MYPLGHGRSSKYRLATDQLTIFHTGDNADARLNRDAKAFSVLTTGQHSGTSNVDTPHYAGNTISFDAATKKILDSGNGLITFLTGDTIRVRGSVSNDGVYTIASGGVAGEMVTTESLVNEASGAYLTLCKRTTPSNNAVWNLQTGQMWRRYATKSERVGVASNGKLCWYDAAACYTLHAAGADLSMNAATKILRIVNGAAEAPRYWAGQLLQFAGFAITNNNRAGGYVVQSVTINGADLDILLWTGFTTTPVVLIGTTVSGNKVISGLASTLGLRIGMPITGTGVGANSVIASIDSATQVTGTVNSTISNTVSVTFTTLATEAAGGSRSIKLVCRSVYAYIAACNAAALGGYTDWRKPFDMELADIRDMEPNTAVPNAAAFPSWPSDDYIWSSTANPSTTSYAMVVFFTNGSVTYSTKVLPYYAALLRGS